MSPELQKEINVLALLDQLAYELGEDANLADKIASRMESSTGGRKLRSVILNRRAEQSYYSEEYALALKPYLDNIETANPVLFTKAAFGNLSIRTIYLRVYQAWLWLMDHHEEREKYKALKSLYEITQNKYDVRIRKKERASAVLFGKVQEEKHDDIIPLQNKIDTFLMKEMEHDMEIFEQKNLSLSPEHIDQILDSLTGLDGITAKVEKNIVKILRRKV